MLNYIEDNPERASLTNTLEELIERHGANRVIWSYVTTLSTDKIKELLDDLKWSLGED